MRFFLALGRGLAQAWPVTIGTDLVEVYRLTTRRPTGPNPNRQTHTRSYR